MIQPWKTRSSSYAVDDRWMRLRADVCERADGHEIAPYYVWEVADFVHCLPVLDDGRIVLVRQYRHAAGTIGLELPGGMLDAGEDPLIGARRELREECGATGGDWSKVASFYPNPARQTNQFHCFLGRDVQLDEEPTLDANEEMEIHLLRVAEIDAAIADGSFHLGFHIAAYLMARPQLDF